MRLTRKTGYYEGTVYEFNLPTGWSCPMAKQCLVRVDRDTGKQSNKSRQYRCYAASAERFPGVRDSRWHNFEFMRSKPDASLITLDAAVRSVRIHASGDFFNQSYFDLWLEICRRHPEVEFWAYTKSIEYWLERIDDVPSNLTLNASLGGKQDDLIDRDRMKFVEVVPRLYDANYAVDKRDDLARIPFRYLQRFSLVDNFASDNKKQRAQQARHE